MAKGLRGWRAFVEEFGDLVQDADKLADEVIRKWLTEQKQKLLKKRYPPELPNQRYQRTGKLGRGWRADLQAHAIRNPVKYAGYVVGKQYQAPIHKNRWWIAIEEVEADLPALLDALGTRYTAELTGGE